MKGIFYFILKNLNELQFSSVLIYFQSLLAAHPQQRLIELLKTKVLAYFFLFLSFSLSLSLFLNLKNDNICQVGSFSVYDFHEERPRTAPFYRISCQS
jgi:hypothetical protein